MVSSMQLHPEPVRNAEVITLLRDLAWIRGLPADDPDRAAWIEQKRCAIERLEALKR